MKSLSLLALLGSLAACNTFEGIGRDLAAGGEAITTAAEDAQQPQPSVYQQARPPVQPPAYQQPGYQPQAYQQQPAQPVYRPAVQQPAAPVYAPAPIETQQLPSLPPPQNQQPTTGPYGF